jgi:hypothetical protein
MFGSVTKWMAADVETTWTVWCWFGSSTNWMAAGGDTTGPGKATRLGVSRDSSRSTEKT